ncbi:Nucleotide-binding protein, UspA family [Halorhabdus sp. SVX81]|uniref:universal stress protein n=1 Tax=Halorhabdus sp. SVX81 TaxID=2978283 RepID=UPI0023DCE8DF|nr:universal stress protein [Halorhabdus sp. SVX81]WEL16237.1 Nucleotide-binding protein, UspA family [Halorhabdus sp. SVX81]
MTRPSVLVPIRVLEGESLPEGVPDLLSNAHVVLLGYHVIPGQTAPGQARMQFEDRALDRLEDFEQALSDAGATVDHRLVFTHDAQQTIDRQIAENDCLAALVPRALADLEDILVAVRGTVGIDRLAQVVAGLFADRDIDVTLYHVTGEDETDEDVDVLLDGLTDRLADEDVDPARIKTRVDRDVKPVDAIAELAEDYDCVVMGESDPTLSTFVFGMPADQVADRFLGPVLVVQRESSEA